MNLIYLFIFIKLEEKGFERIKRGKIPLKTPYF
jgi:hypothetical protein